MVTRDGAEDIDALAREVAARLERIDALLLFAAVAELAPFDAVSRESFDRQFAVNTRGAFFAIQRQLPLDREGGSIAAEVAEAVAAM